MCVECASLRFDIDNNTNGLSLFSLVAPRLCVIIESWSEGGEREREREKEREREREIERKSEEETMIWPRSSRSYRNVLH